MSDMSGMSHMNEAARGVSVGGGHVRALHFAVNWLSPRPLDWLEDAFPAPYSVEGWNLILNEKTLDATPPMPMSEDAARSALMPMLETWSAALEVEHRLPVMFYYNGADIESTEDAAGTAVAAGVATASVVALDPTVVTKNGTPPEPDLSWQDTEAASLARVMCLRPFRNGTRPVADATYWLFTHLKKWAGSDEDAAARLKVSAQYLKQLGRLSGGSDERKVALSSRTLTPQDKAWLSEALEELIRRLQLVESGRDPGEHLTRAD